AQEMAASVRSLAGTVAQGSRVAQVVSELAGERVRTRRLDLDRQASSQRHSTPPTLSGTRMRTATPPVPHTPSQPFAAAGSPGALATIAAREMRGATPSAPEVETSYAPRPLPARRAAKTPIPPSTSPSASAAPPPLPRAQALANEDDDENDLP